MSKSPLEEQGPVIQNWQQFESIQQGNERGNITPTGQTQFPLKRKQRASAQDWFEERQSQKPKITAAGPNGVQSNVTAIPTSEFASHNPRLRSVEQAALPQHTTPASPHFHQTYSHTHPVPNQEDQSLPSSIESSRMQNWRSSEQSSRREFGDTGRRSPSRDPRMGYGSDRRTAYHPHPPLPAPPPLLRSGGRRNSVDRGHHDRRSPPPSRREEDRDWPRDHREYRDRNDRPRVDTNNLPTGPRGTFMSFQTLPDIGSMPSTLSALGDASPIREGVIYIHSIVFWLLQTPGATKANAHLIADGKQMSGQYKSASNQSTPQGYSNQQGNQFRTLDPRLAGRVDTRSGPMAEGSPPDVMDVDPANVVEGGPGTRSGSRTPNTPSTPIVGPPRQKNELHSVLLEFSNRTLQLSSLEMKREAAVKELNRQAQAFEHSRRYHDKFPSLSEQQVNNRARAQKDLDDLNRKLKEEEIGRNRIIEAITSRVMPGNGPTTESETTRRLEKELSDVKFQQIPAMQRDFGDQRAQVVDLRAQVAEMRNQHKGVGSISSRVDRIQTRLDDFPNLRLDVDKMREELRRIINMLERQIKEFKELKITVEGEDGSGGLLEFVAALEKSNAEAGDILDQNTVDLETLQKDVDSIKNPQDVHDAKDEATSNARNSAKATLQMEQSVWDVVAKVQLKLSDLYTKVETSRDDITDIIAQERKRDEFITEEIERVAQRSENISTKTKASFEEMRRSHNETITRLDSSISRLNSSVSDVKAKVNSTPPPAPNVVPPGATQPPVVGVGRLEYERNLAVHNSRVDELQRKAGSLEVKLEANTQSLQHLDYRYNNLTTEALATNMVGQIQTSVQPELDQLRKDQAALQEQIQQLANKVDRFSEFQNSSNTDALRTELVKLTSKLDTLEERIQRTRMSTATEIGKHSAQIEKIYVYTGLEPPEKDDDIEEEE